MDGKIKKKIIIYNIVSNIISSITSIVVITILLLIFNKKVIDYIEIIKIGYILVVFNCLFKIFIEPFIQIKTRSYNITSKAVEYTYGTLSISKTIIPINRVQQVTITNGPILNAFGLVEVDILTTTTTHKLKNITVTQGDAIVKEITDILYDKSKVKVINEVYEDK
ncbi:MAG: PH domain-containing protein [Clostridium sp.]|nr:PH domain-containing protein [Clostridium sp.]